MPANQPVFISFVGSEGGEIKVVGIFFKGTLKDNGDFMPQTPRQEGFFAEVKQEAKSLGLPLVLLPYK